MGRAGGGGGGAGLSRAPSRLGFRTAPHRDPNPLPTACHRPGLIPPRCPEPPPAPHTQRAPSPGPRPPSSIPNPNPEYCPLSYPNLHVQPCPHPPVSPASLPPSPPTAPIPHPAAPQPSAHPRGGGVGGRSQSPQAEGWAGALTSWFASAVDGVGLGPGLASFPIRSPASGCSLGFRVGAQAADRRRSALTKVGGLGVTRAGAQPVHPCLVHQSQFPCGSPLPCK